MLKKKTEYNRKPSKSVATKHESMQKKESTKRANTKWKQVKFTYKPNSSARTLKVEVTKFGSTAQIRERQAW